MKFKELKEFWMHQAHEHNACKEQTERLKRARSEVSIAKIWLDNWDWCFERGLTTDEMLKHFDPKVLLKVGFLTQDNNPLDFTPQEIGGLTWEPFNVGASLENPIGEYLTFDQANDPERGLKVPSRQNYDDLVSSGSLWGQYLGIAGRVFDRGLFIPASGLRHRASGAMAAVGNSGYSWASTVSGVNAYFLYFYYANIYPSHVGSRAHGLQVRCLRE